MGKRKTKNWQVNITFFFLLLAGVVFISLSFKAFSLIKHSVFDGQNRITLVVDSAKGGAKEDILVFSLEPANRSISLLRVPANTNVQVSKNYGTYQLGNVYRLGGLDPSQGGGGELLGRTVQDFIGAPIDGWFVSNWEFSLKREDLESRGMKTLVREGFSIKNALIFLKNSGLADLDTNLTIIDMLRVWHRASSVTIDKIEVSDLRNTRTLKKMYLPGETEVYEIDPRTLDEMTISLFYDARALKERKTVEIINGAGVAGLGSNVARVVNNMGAQVLFVKTSQEKIEHSRVSGGNKESYTVRKISKNLGIPIVKREDGDGPPSGIDITIFIGEDYLK